MTNSSNNVADGGEASKMKSYLPFIEEVRRRYRAEEASVFILHGNVFDEFLYNGVFVSLQDLLVDMLKETMSGIALYDPSMGISFNGSGVDETLKTSTEGAPPLERLEYWMKAKHAGATIINYASLVVPAGDDSMLAEADRAASARLHRWSLSDWMVKRNNAVFLLTETLTEIHPRLLSNPRIGVVHVPLPTEKDRADIIKATGADFEGNDLRRLSEQTSGLRGVHLRQIFAKHTDAGISDETRSQYIKNLLGSGADIEERTKQLMAVTANMTLEAIGHMINPDNKPATVDNKEALSEISLLVRKRKKEIIEKECAGLLEFVEPNYGLEAVGGNPAVRERLQRVITAIQSGDSSRVPMGMLFVGPMGTGKTYVAKAFAGSCGVAAVSLKNFRSKWVGSSEANLERVLSTVKAMGPVVVLIDEGDRSFGNGGGEGGDDGTSSRIIARLKEFMSDPDNRGRVIFILMTNRPDKLDADIKRAGRLDLKIPFFYADSEADRQSLLAAICKRYKVPVEICKPLPDAYSSADYEAVVLETSSRAKEDGRGLEASDFTLAANDYLPSKDARMLSYMELLAVFESSSKSLVPKRFQEMKPEEINQALDKVRVNLGIR